MHRPPEPAPSPTGAQRPNPSPRTTVRGRLGLLAIVPALVLALGAAPAAVAAPGDPPAPAPCPAPVPVAQVTKGLTGYGLTVSEGTRPERFSVQVLGVLKDGVAPGVDMIIVNTDSPALEKAHGIWAGMSGSPVYTDDGRWVGAVAYGLSAGPSKIGGLAAAEDMAKLLGEGAAQVQTRDQVPLTRALQTQVADTPDATARQAAAGLARLPVPLGVSGVGARRLGQLSKRLTRGDDNLRLYAASGVRSGATADPAEIVPGGNIAATISTGDVTAGGVGTTTVVCDGAALAFGHPFQLVGPSTFGAHTADAITIQDDPTFTPFKLANFGGVVGTVDQDRTSGIRATLGKGPAVVPLTSTVTDRASGRTRDGATDLDDQSFIDAVALFHTLANLDRTADRVGRGRSELSWTVTGTTGAGQAWTLTRDNRYASDDDISFDSVLELAGQLDALRRSRLEQVRFTDVKVRAAVASEWRGYRLGKVETKVGSRWVVADRRHPITGRAGVTTSVRVHLLPDRGQGAQLTVGLAVKVPRGTSGQEGDLDIGGGQGYEGPVGTTGEEPKSFAEQLRSLSDAPHNNEVLAGLLLATEDEEAPPAATVRHRTPQIVTGSASIPFRIR
ncbi:MAG TPA: SpoIVB peptidase S55 domain-containing protein [Actinomycetes bacterium]|nr:SpoIVB peptidase S55 domain-containing protein [Actinomycetes bacterium]